MGEDRGGMIEVRDVGGVAVARVLDEEIRQPAAAADLGADLGRLAGEGGPRRVVVDLGRARYLCSSAFAVLVNFARKVEASGGAVRLCGLHPDVAVGANIIGLGRVVPIHDDRDAALASF